MKKIRKGIFGLILSAGMVVGILGTALAASTGIMNSPSNTAGSWWSGYDNSQIFSLSTSNTSIYGGDVGIYFYESSVGMPESFVKSTSRTAQFELKEEDGSLLNGNEIARKYTGYFALDSSGRYRITSYANTYVNTNCIESNNVAELYMRVKVGTISGDTTKNVPAGLFRYEIWLV